ncbi:cryptochrome/photolyase family protein [Pseudomarimonas salicorniae]|uniref:Cryptochrome/photolyase family protein n=1 Tax=Pseudomarimonas salicorniae TaxID=2933270 RepID=A0ABT0GH99_9GAMM|nr:cryptochrome/photolyase family protein [Lysobacter sp. CAU 1642]MCK7593919.1 cryptochrome/photolyase family protein [Lysobacter sp. CAU 1642]
MSGPMRNLCLVLGDQLDAGSALFEGFEPESDRVWMAEVGGEATHVWSTKARIAVFLAGMRHFRQVLHGRGWPLDYLALDEHDFPGLAEALAASLQVHRPQRVLCVCPGEWRLRESLRETVEAAGCEWVEVPDRHFYCDPESFSGWAKGRKTLRLEHFYRWLRRRESVLLDDCEPCGGEWNFDAENRASFGREGPGLLPAPHAFEPDRITRGVIELVEAHFPDHPGTLDDFDWPVNAAQARQALDDFIRRRLPGFGQYQDAMWTREPWLYHSRLSAAMNLKLISPREVVEAAEAAYRAGDAPIAAVEGFIRQVIGWREFVRGVYWLRMPDFAEANVLGADQPLPAFYWTGDTDMACLRDALWQTLRFGYAHHIQRLMVLGLFAQLLGVKPEAIHHWFLAVFVDAVEWVELPNVLGMSQYADGGFMVSKPYVASGNYINRMSNYCGGCRYRYGNATGDDACPFTTLYWDFLERHRDRFSDHPRTALQWKSLARKSDQERDAIARQAKALRERLAE